MASIKYSDIEKELKKLSSDTLHLEIGYNLLKAFGTSDTYIKRYKTGKGNLATFDGILIKKQFAYKPVTTLQLTDELEALKQDAKIAKQNPRIIAVSDGETLLAYDTKERESYENKVDKIWLDFQFFYPLAGVDKFYVAEEAEADIKAAVKMAKLHSEIRRQNEISSETDVHDLNIFMTRLLFCFFAEDTGIFEKNIFSNYIKQCTQEDGSDLSESLESIFNVMDKTARIDLPNAIKQFPYVNGGLFHQQISIPQLSYKVRKIILECGELNWGEINPDIFGSMFQGVVTPELRGDFGMHYTSVPNILKLIQPLFLNELEEAFAKAWDTEKQLNALLVRIAKMKFFDPACGSGNFLIITYKELRKLEIRIWQRIEELTGSHAIPYTNISIMQFYGIEIDSFAHEVAMLSLWLAEHQMNALFSKAFSNVKIDALPLKNIDNICQGNACRVDWNEVCPHTPADEVFVMGNPPYIGSRNQDENQKEDLDLTLNKIQFYRKLDYIAIWFYKASQFIKKSQSKSAFVSTNSICQGEQVSILWEPIFDLGLEIDFAYESFKWSNNASNNAGVTVVIIGLRNKGRNKKVLFSSDKILVVDEISPALTDSKNRTISKQLKPISAFPEMRRGNMPNDQEFLRISPQEKAELLQKYPDISGIIRRQIGSDEFINCIPRYCYWISDEKLSFAMSFSEVKTAIENCYNYRINSKDKTLHSQAKRAHQFREFFECNENSLLIPIVSSESREYIPMGFVNNGTIVPNSAQVIYNANFLIFGLLTSKIHNVWVRHTAGRLENRFRYSIFLCYNTFPFPDISLNKRKIIDALAEEVLLTRENHSHKTLAEMYDPDKMPADLRAAHHALDMAVDGCYQSTPFNNDEERLACLFKLYEKMTK
jgi:type I restriction-modification system DNA methylase subunit